jgi:hypothetical protein
MEQDQVSSPQRQAVEALCFSWGLGPLLRDGKMHRGAAAFAG